MRLKNPLSETLRLMGVTEWCAVLEPLVLAIVPTAIASGLDPIRGALARETELQGQRARGMLAVLFILGLSSPLSTNAQELSSTVIGPCADKTGAILEECVRARDAAPPPPGCARVVDPVLKARCAALQQVVTQCRSLGDEAQRTACLSWRTTKDALDNAKSSAVAAGPLAPRTGPPAFGPCQGMSGSDLGNCVRRHFAKPSISDPCAATKDPMRARCLSAIVQMVGCHTLGDFRAFEDCMMEVRPWWIR
jgi:hypothetical protein